MTFEVEQKFPVADQQVTVQHVDTLGARWNPRVEQVDTYLAHPVRDFASTDEALRIRRVGNRIEVTYKGPKIDATTKTRREIEFSLGEDQSYDEALSLFEHLGFRSVAKVHKYRRTAELRWENHTFEVALDEVRDVGQFIELETAADETQLEAARHSLASLAIALGLQQSERRSYLELLLLSKDAAGPTRA